MNQRITALILLASVVFFRVGTAFASPDIAAQLSGFGPFAALVLGAAILLPGARNAWIPAAMFLVSDLVLNVAVYKTAAFTPFALVSMAFYCVLFLLASPLATRRALALPFLGSTVAAVVAFHLVANTASWLADPAYAKSAAGLVQAHTTGLPGFPSPVVFLLKSLAGNLVFAGLFLLALAPGRASVPASTPARA